MFISGWNVYGQVGSFGQSPVDQIEGTFDQSFFLPEDFLANSLNHKRVPLISGSNVQRVFIPMHFIVPEDMYFTILG